MGGKPMDFSHLDNEGRPRMVDVGNKANTVRRAKAEGLIRLQPETLALLKDGKIPKGNVLVTAELAGISAAKQTASLIPLCHTLLISVVKVECLPCDEGIVVKAEVGCTGQTGVEMEALTAVSVACLTIYDMCKAVDKKMEIVHVRLTEKTKREINA
jgi:cyclic pyranopterin phosphate synthase